MQVYNITLNKNDKLSCLVSDGQHCIKAFLKDKDTLQPGRHDNSIIRVIQHIATPGGKKIGISQFELLCQYGSLIGNPQPIDQTTTINPEATDFAIDPQLVKLEHIPIFQGAKNRPLTEASNRTAKTEVKEEPKQARK